MDSDLYRHAQARVEQSRILVAENRRQVENARLLIDRQRRRVVVGVKELNDVVVVSGLASQENTLRLCEQFQKWGVKTTIGMLPGSAGYQVSIYRVGLTEAKVILAQLGFDAE